MRTRTKFILTTLAIGIALWGFLGPHGPPGNQLWPEPNPPEEPSGVQVPLLITYGALSAFATGFGISYWAYGYQWTKRAFPAMAMPAHVALGFIPGSFWLHDTLHMVFSDSMVALVVLEYTFHLPLIIAGAVLVAATIRSVGHERPGYAARA